MKKRNQAGRAVVPGFVVERPSSTALGPTVGFLSPVSYAQLVAQFGQPLILPEPEEADGRTQVIWRLRWNDGSVNEIYDYKVGPFWLGPLEGIPYPKVTEWDVSGDHKGYLNLVKLFHVSKQSADRVANKKKRSRPNIAWDLIEPVETDPRSLKRRLLK